MITINGAYMNEYQEKFVNMHCVPIKVKNCVTSRHFQESK